MNETFHDYIMNENKDLGILIPAGKQKVTKLCADFDVALKQSRCDTCNIEEIFNIKNEEAPGSGVKNKN